MRPGSSLRASTQEGDPGRPTARAARNEVRGTARKDDAEPDTEEAKESTQIKALCEAQAKVEYASLLADSPAAIWLPRAFQ